ncbi:MAG TPA: 3-hydroxyacyl-CoA dehydrogenase NAD-binding domain-containing protein [Candidatus Limnocylindria bacterium]|nr:3-hydroxyacyl-CoA dehydrogenase NAD-binding domain-containing protein [Candidatus Limnocylindria bacterium]
MIVGIVGAGTMGAGIAQVCLQAGHEVVLYDVDEAAIERGRERIAEGLARLVAKGSLTQAAVERLLGALRNAYTLEALAAEAELVIEAALEDLELKRTIFRALSAAAAAGSALATNTSALSVTEIADASGVRERVVGLHFFNPAPVMPLVEVVLTDATDARTATLAVRFVEDLGKVPIVCRDAPGFIVNRVNRPYTLEALRMLEAGDASVEQIDGAMVAAGYPMGPLALMDLVGVDVSYAVATALWQAFEGAIRFAPSPIQRRLVEAGRLGRKTGEGFYRYEGGRPVGLSPGLDEAGVGAAEAGGLASADIVERIELAIINEAYHAAGEGVAEAGAIDRALKLGANHPHGPFERAGQLGLRAVIDGLSRLEATHGERFAVAPALWAVASI